MYKNKSIWFLALGSIIMGISIFIIPLGEAKVVGGTCATPGFVLIYHMLKEFFEDRKIRGK